MKRKGLKIGLLCSIFFTMPVSAEFIDNGTYTTDTVGGLDWLDVTNTVGRNYDEISSLMDPGEEFYGWRYAYGSEFQEMVNGFTGINNTSLSEVIYWNSFVMQDLLNLIGIAYQQVNSPEDIVYQTLGMLEDTNDNGDHMAAYILHHITATTQYGASRVEQGYYSPSGNQPNMGSFLVRNSAAYQNGYADGYNAGYDDGLLQCAPPEEVIICHVKRNGRTMTKTVSGEELQNHLDHGDTLGACP